MTHTPSETGHLAGRDGTQLQYRVWPAESPKGTVLVVHGFGEHGLRYGPLVDALLPAGWTVLSYDARGHGHSGGTRTFCSSFQEFTDDLARFVALAREKLPQPLVLFGHSMGGLVVLRTLVDQPRLVDAVVLSNPALRNKVHVPTWKEGLGQVASRLAPRLSIPAGIPATHVSRDPLAVQAYDTDPLVSKTATARWYTEFCKAQDVVLARGQDLRDVPMLALLGDGDLIIDSQVGRSFFEKNAGRDTTLRVYPGYYHELIHEPEPDRARVFADLTAWLDAHPRAV